MNWHVRVGTPVGRVQTLTFAGERKWEIDTRCFSDAFYTWEWSRDVDAGAQSASPNWLLVVNR